MKLMLALCAILLLGACSIALAEAQRNDCDQVPVYLYIAQSVDVDIDTGTGNAIVLDVEHGQTGAHAEIPFTVLHNVWAAVTMQFQPPDVPCPNIAFNARFAGTYYPNYIELARPPIPCVQGSGTYHGTVLLDVSGVTIDVPANCYGNGWLKICVNTLCPPIVCPPGAVVPPCN